MINQRIENCDDLGYELINQFFLKHPDLANQYQVQKVIYCRDNIYNGKKYYQVFIITLINSVTNQKLVLKFSNKLKTNSRSLNQNEQDIILKEYTIHKKALQIEPNHTLNIYNHWIFSFQYNHDYYHYLVILMEKGHPLDKLYLNKNIINRSDYKKFIVSVYLNALNVLIDYENKNLLHRDIKPANIYLANGKVKIGDFDCSTINYSRTQYQTSVVSPIYAAPETYPNKIKAKYGSKSQVFSIAVAIAITLNKGELIGVSKKEAKEITTNQLRLNDYNLNRHSPKFTKEPLINKNDSLNHILLKGLRYDPRFRATMIEFARELEHYLATYGNYQTSYNWSLILLIGLLFSILVIFIM